MPPKSGGNRARKPADEPAAEPEHPEVPAPEHPDPAPEPEQPGPVPVAEQKAAGVPPEETVTIAEQKAGAEPPAAVAPEPISTGMRAGGGTGNESPRLPATVTSGAARAHALLSHAEAAGQGGDMSRVLAIIARVKAELDRYLPTQVRDAAAAEAQHVVATEL